MARIRQQYPQNYGSSGNINTEFESVIRYLNAAEIGDNTIGELLGKIFDNAGNWNGPVEFRKDSSSGIQYRVGEYANADTGWQTLATLAELRGEDGAQASEIGAPIFFGRVDFTPTAGQTEFEYAHSTTDSLLVYQNGILKAEGALNDYTTSATGGSSGAGSVTFNTGLTTSDSVTIFKVRSTSITGYTRSDTVTTATQINFPFTHDENTKLQVYLNGILQKEGGTDDYTTIPAQNVIQFNTGVPANNLVTIITVENTSVQAVTGLMFEENFVHTDTGLIKFPKLSIADGDIAQAKVANLTSSLTEKAKITVGSNTPTNPATGDLWHDTSINPNQLKFYDGTMFLRTSPESSLPTFQTTDAGKFVKVNNTGTSLEYGNPDFSGLIPINQKGASSGVASLDSQGKLPQNQLPTTLASDSFYAIITTAANSPYVIKRIFKQKITIDGIALQTSTGTCSVQIAVDGVGYGDVHAVSSVPTEISALGSVIEVNATSQSHSVGFIVTNNSSAGNLEVVLAVAISAV
ncbi:MAG: hypothetical protein CMK23_08290 [Porticoccaceae bacterium]|nr:hypothetical protein [Porticoccaceae bacterium]MAK89593.1 hypothetical protein [Euryarchaeota archaeon]|tara:strand:- start:7984 stop:9546 length:1563 start_codon:yes stop_codon:yes gene_type:complete